MEFDINANCSLRITIRNVMYKILQLPHHRCRNNVGSGYRITHGSSYFKTYCTALPRMTRFK